MKNIIILLLFAMITYGSYAQQCSGSPNGITPVPGYAAGLSPGPDSLPCQASGQAVEDTLYFHNFSIINGLPVDILTIDSIENLPAGLCWKSNKSNNSYGPGEDGVIYIHGTQTGAAGQYLLRIKVSVNAGSGAINISRYDAGSLLGMRYYLKVACSSGNCVAVNGDTINSFLPYTSNCTIGAFSHPLISTITASGSTTFCSGDSVTLTANTDSIYDYLWSTGATTSSIIVNAGGAYTVTIRSANDSAISNQVTVIVNSCHAYGAPGFSPASDQLPCMDYGQYAHDTIYFINYSSISGLAVNSLKIDSIENLPAGVNWHCYKPNNTFAAGDSGWIQLEGHETGLPGQYKLRIIVDLNVGPGGGINIPQADMESLLHVRYYVRVACGNGYCNPLINDTINTYIADTSCASTPTAIIAVYNNPNPCYLPVLTANPGLNNGYSYLWSTGERSQTIYATSSGVYTVTAYYNGTDSVVSAPQTVTVNPHPTALFSLQPDPNTPHVWTVVNQCTGNQLSYTWNWGDSTSSTGATPNHTYNAARYYSVCVYVTDSAGCSAYYCDSNAYLYKTDAQMIQLNVVQYATGINDVTVRTPEMRYYAGAIHFSEAIEMPATITLYDLSGRVVTEERRFTGSLWSINTGMAAGVYVVQIRNDSYSVSKKLMLIK